MSATGVLEDCRPDVGRLPPQAWLDLHLEAHGRAVDEEPVEDASVLVWADLAGLAADNVAHLSAVFGQLTADGTARPAAAAKWTLSWTAGPVADAVGYVLATAGAGVLLDESRVRVRIAPGGWVDRVRLEDATVAVPPGHPWAGLDRVAVLADEDEVDALTVASLVRALGPLVEVAHTLARVGRRSLWAEVADAMGSALAFDHDLPVDDGAASRLRRALSARGAPWGRRPRLGVRDSGVGAYYVMQRGGCCLAYQSPETPPPPLEDLTPDLRAYRERFPSSPGEPRYCSTCSLRDAADCDARRLFWVERHRSGAGHAVTTT